MFDKKIKAEKDERIENQRLNEPIPTVIPVQIGMDDKGAPIDKTAVLFDTKGGYASENFN